MQKRLQQIGNSLGITIDKPVLELLKIDRETVLEVRTDGVRLILEPVRDPSRKERVAKSIDRVMTKHSKLMGRLAK